MNDGERPKDKQEDRLREYAEWKERYEASQEDPRQLLQQISRIALFMSYDLIDKLRWWEKETLKLPDEEIAKRTPHIVSFLDKLRAAYLDFANVDL